METKKKIKILTLSDDPRMLSGVAIQTRYFIEGLLKTGDFCFVSIAGAMKQMDHRPVMLEPWGEDWKVIPVDGFGDHNLVRSVLMVERPDIVWIMTDPRYWTWLWQIEDEIRAQCPLVYYHVWDNLPAPKFNKPWYDSNDVIVSISKLTRDVVAEVASDEVVKHYLPHTVDDKEYFLLDEITRLAERKEILKTMKCPEDSFLLFFNNRNARRKHGQTLLFWMSKFYEEYPDSKVRLLAHTDPFDPNGSNLLAFMHDFNLTNKVFINNERLTAEKMNELYNASDATINLSDAEGFGMATLESLFSGTPIIAVKTGGLQDQTKDRIHGMFIEPCSRMIVGTQDVPYIYEDRVSYEDFRNTLKQMTFFIESGLGTKEENKRELRESCQKHARENFNIENYIDSWKEIMHNTYDKFGSWETRKGYIPFKLSEV